MDTKSLKEKIINGQISDEELSALLGNNKHVRSKGSFLRNILKGFIDGYTVPNMWKTFFESFLILVIIIGAIILSYTGKMDNMITAVLLSSVLGFLFGKIK